MTTIGKLLNDAKKEAGLTSQQVADKLNISLEAWNKMISGERRFQTEMIPRMCEVLPLNGAAILIALGICTGLECDDDSYIRNMIGDDIFELPYGNMLIGPADKAILALMREYCDIDPNEDDPRLGRILMDLQHLRDDHHNRASRLGDNETPTENDMKTLRFLTDNMDKKRRIIIGTNAIAESTDLSYLESTKAVDRLRAMNYLEFTKTLMPGETHESMKKFFETHDPEEYEYNFKMIIELLKKPNGEYYYDGWPQLDTRDIFNELPIFDPKGGDAKCLDT